jgi:hypothetical protein
MEGMALITVEFKAIGMFHSVNAGVVAFPAGGVHVRVNRIGNRSLPIGLSMTDKALDEDYTMLAFIPVLGDFGGGLYVALKTIGRVVRALKMGGKFTPCLWKGHLDIGKRDDP